MTKTLRVGLLGAGYIVDSHATALQALPGARLVAVCDKSLARARAVASRYGLDQAYGDLQELLAADIDVVHVLLPPDAHAWGAGLALAAGKHVLLEKPMCATATQCHDLVRQSSTGKGRLGVSHNFLFGRKYEELRRDVKEGVFGPLDHLTVNWLMPLPFVRHGPFDNWIVRETRNSFVETAPHLLAFVFDLLGGLDDIRCQAAQPVTLPTGVVVYRKWSVIAQRGATTVSINLAMTDGYPERTLRLRGRAGSASYDFDRDLLLRKWVFNQNPVFDHIMQGGSEVRQIGVAAASNFVRAVRGTLAKTAQAGPYAESFQRSLAAFYDGLAGGSLDARLDAGLGARILDACEAAVAESGVEAKKATAPVRLAGLSAATWFQNSSSVDLGYVWSHAI
jgi:predicted dehydrogenase